MNYTRKRALLACDFCRHRKRRCDGERPCSTCRESNADCHYKDLPVERVELPTTSNEALAERLGHIEALLEEQGLQLRQFLGGDSVDVSVTAATTSPSVAASHLSTSSRTAVDASVPALYPIAPTISQPQPQPQPQPSSAPVPTVVPRMLPLSHQGPYAHLVSSSVPATASDVSSRTPEQLSPPLPTPLPPPLPPPSPPLLPPPHRALAARPDSEDHPFLIPYEHSTAANTLLSLPLVRFFLRYQARRMRGAVGAAGPRRGRRKRRRRHDFGESSRREENDYDYDNTSDNDDPDDTPSMNPHDDDGDENNSHVDDSHDSHDSHDSYDDDDDDDDDDDSNLEMSLCTDAFVYPRTHFFDLEADQPLPPALDLIRSPGLVEVWPPRALVDGHDHSTALEILRHNYFAHVHPNAPLFSAAQFATWSARLDESVGDLGNVANVSSETAICLAVWALGALVVAKPTTTTPVDDTHPLHPLALFQSALRIILHHAVWPLGRASLTTCQALLLAAAYFALTVRPLHSARMVHLACRELLRLMDEQRRDGRRPEQDEQLLPVFWVAFLWECDRAAELDIPRSGIEPLADGMPLAFGLDSDGADMFGFMAQIALRKLLNSTHSLLYATRSAERRGSVSYATHKRKRSSLSDAHATDIVRMLPVCAELNRQLEEYYQTIPVLMRPPVGEGEGEDGDGDGDEDDEDDEDDDKGNPSPPPPLQDRVQLLRVQYYAIRHLIHRPFLLSVAWHCRQRIMALDTRWSASAGLAASPAATRRHLSRRRPRRHRYWSLPLLAPPTPSLSPPQPPPQLTLTPTPPPPPLPLPTLPASVLDKCVICVDACVAYLVHVLPLLDRRSPYLWSLCQTSMACLLVLLIADACPEIHARARARRHDIATLRDRLVGKLRPWAAEGPSLGAELRIVKSLPIPPRRQPQSRRRDLVP